MGVKRTIIVILILLLLVVVLSEPKPKLEQIPTQQPITQPITETKETQGSIVVLGGGGVII